MYSLLGMENLTYQSWKKFSRQTLTLLTNSLGFLLKCKTMKVATSLTCLWMTLPTTWFTQWTPTLYLLTTSKVQKVDLCNSIYFLLETLEQQFKNCFSDTPISLSCLWETNCTLREAVKVQVACCTSSLGTHS